VDQLAPFRGTWVAGFHHMAFAIVSFSTGFVALHALFVSEGLFHPFGIVLLELIQ
jgi:hypothetical protein